MNHLDKDILSIQQTRDLLKSPSGSEGAGRFSQEKVDSIVEAMAVAGYRNAARLAELAVKETGIGLWLTR